MCDQCNGGILSFVRNKEGAHEMKGNDSAGRAVFASVPCVSLYFLIESRYTLDISTYILYLVVREFATVLSLNLLRLLNYLGQLSIYGIRFALSLVSVPDRMAMSLALRDRRLFVEQKRRIHQVELAFTSEFLSNFDVEYWSSSNI